MAGVREGRKEVEGSELCAVQRRFRLAKKKKSPDTRKSPDLLSVARKAFQSPEMAKSH